MFQTTNQISIEEKFNIHWISIKSPFKTEQIPFGKCLHNYGKSPSFMGKLTISMAIFNSKRNTLPDGNLTIKIAIEIVSFPINSMAAW